MRHFSSLMMALALVGLAACGEDDPAVEPAPLNLLTRITCAQEGQANTVFSATVDYNTDGTLSGIAGLVLLSRTNSGQPSSGTDFEMDAITAVVLGGVSLTGGEGKLSLVMVGVLIMGVLSTGMLMCNINDYVQQLVKGLVLIGAVAFSSISQKVRQNMGAAKA